GSLLLGVSCLTAQNLPSASVQDLQVVKTGGGLRVEITLSKPVKPSVIVATNPDRLVIELPDTISGGKQKQEAVHAAGVRRIRMGLHQAEPPVTHVVVDLERSVPYQLLNEGNKITLILSPETLSKSQHKPPASAASRGLLGGLRSGPKTGEYTLGSAQTADIAGGSTPSGGGASPPSTATRSDAARSKFTSLYGNSIDFEPGASYGRSGQQLSVPVLRFHWHGGRRG
ncbi:MAG: AMIN domain-containing protein, partial [Terriglobales bacterium]